MSSGGADYTAHPQHVKDALTDLRHAPKAAQLLLASKRLPYLREMARLRVAENGEVEEVPEVGPARVEEHCGMAEYRDPGAGDADGPGIVGIPGSGLGRDLQESSRFSSILPDYLTPYSAPACLQASF